MFNPYFSSMKLGLISAMHGRSELTAMWAEHTSQFGIPVYAAITDGDYDNLETAWKYKFEWKVMPNNPVGDKFQAALTMAMQDGCDVVMRLPSDDFISKEWVAMFELKASLGADYFIPERIAVHDPSKGTYSIRANVGSRFMKYGAGACFSRKAVEKCGGLWTGHLDSGLDTESNNRLRTAGYECEAVPTKDIALVDIKTGESIWPWGIWSFGEPACSDDEALHMLSPSMRQTLSTNNTPTLAPVASELK